MRHEIRLVLMIALFTAACSEGVIGPDTNEAVATVVVSPSSVSLTLGGTRELTATARSGRGVVMEGRTITWESGDVAIAEVSSNGLVTARSAGSVRIIATTEGKKGEAQLVVVNPPVDGVQLDRISAALEEGEEVQLTATPTDAQGNSIPGLGIQWSSDAPGIASVEALGKVTAIRPGTANITAKVHGQEISAVVSVSADYAFDLLYTVTTSHLFHEIFALDVRQPGAAPSRLLAPGSWASQPKSSPDGSRIAFVCVGPFGDPAICVANADGSDQKMIASSVGEAFSTPEWNQDGTRLAFTRQAYEGGSVPSYRSRVGVMDADGSNLTILTAEMSGSQSIPAWSPRLGDGSERIAFVHDVNGTNGQYRIWSMRSDGTDKRQVTKGADAVDTQPAWSPDGETIAFQRISPSIFGDIWLVDATGGNERSLRAPLAGTQGSPAWSPDGRLIAFVSEHETYGNETAEYQIYTTWADGSKLARRTFDPGDKAGPAWLSRR